jgi:surface polysaccharide O-acyltransferase-like enzyme
MIGFLATGFLLLKSNKENVLTFKILAQVLVGLFSSKLAIYYKHDCTIQLIKHNIHQLPSLGISWLVE